MTEKLKPCPFCGGEDFEAGADLENEVRGYVECKECGTKIYFPFKESVSAAMVIEAWNSRANEEWIKCSETPPTKGEYYWVDNPYWANPKVLKYCGNVGCSRDIYFFAEETAGYNGEFDEYLPIQVSPPPPFYGTGKQRVRNRIEWCKKRGLLPEEVEE